LSPCYSSDQQQGNQRNESRKKVNHRPQTLPPMQAVRTRLE
jgi:hypothetical protein